MVCSKKKIAFVCGSQNLTPYSEFIPLAIFLEKKQFNTFFVLDNNANISIIEKLNNANINYKIRGKYIRKKRNNKSKRKRIFYNTIIPNKIRILMRQLIDLIFKYNYFTRTDNYIKKLFKEEKPDILIVYGDFVLGLVPSSIKWMRENKKSIIDIQVASNSKEFLYKSVRKNNYNYSLNNPINYLLSLFYKKQKMCFNSECVLFYSWNIIIILHKKNMLPSNPWFKGQSWADKTFFINELSKKENANKLSNHKNKVIGQYSIDLLYHSYQNKMISRKVFIRKYFGVEETTKKIAIFAAPQFYEHNIYDYKTSLNEINYLVQELIKLENLLVFISLHPKMPYSDYSYINQKSENIRVLKDERLSSVLPIGEFFIGAFESTFSWAMLCNVIPVYLDYYNLGFDLKKYKSVNILSEKLKFKNDLKFIISNENTCYNNLLKDKDKLPPFDGKCGDRFLKELNSITS